MNEITPAAMAAATERAINHPPPMGMKAAKLSYLLHAAEDWAKAEPARDPSADEIVALRELVLHIAPNRDVSRGVMDS